MDKIIKPVDTVAWLNGRDRFLLITHKRPDGDTLGSAAALAQGLREQGKIAYLLPNYEVTPRYSKYVDDYYAPDDYEFDHIIAVDTATVDLFPENALKYKDSVSLCIDHHKSNTFYADLICLDSDRASCGELIYEILTILSDTISSVVAERLYVALSTDTGCFSFGNTTSNTLYVASKLVEAGAPNKEINKLLFRTKTRSRVQIEGMITSNIEYSFDDTVAVATITRKMMEITGADEDDLDDIAAIPGSVEGVFVGITIRELTSVTDCKVSVRTRTPYDAQEICSAFGGGGHKQAAGFTVKKPADEVKSDLSDVLSNIFNGE